MSFRITEKIIRGRLRQKVSSTHPFVDARGGLILFLCLLVIISCNVSSVFARNGLKAALYWEELDNNTVRCALCPRRCVIPQGRRGFCGVRINKGGELFTLGYNNPVAVHLDPIEKKPFFHVLPKSGALSIAVAGCNMRCLFCQNWNISQSRPDETINYDLKDYEVISLAKKYKAPSIVFTYTEPTVFYEYMLDIAKLAKKEGLFVGMHSCGYINPAPLGELLNYMDFVNVDLKGFSEDFYNEMSVGAQLEPVLNALKMIKGKGIHLEITNLLIPTKNDSESMIRKMCEWIRDNLGKDTPLHLSRFYPQYRLKNLPPTPIETLKKAYRIAKEVGLLYVYIGNVPGVDEESTFCPRCNDVLIRRVGYSILENNIIRGKCKSCREQIPGVWE